MTEEKERAAGVIEAHGELVGHIERSASRMRALSAVTVVVASVLLVSYAFQLLLPLTGESSVTVNLRDPGNVAAELVVFALAAVWLYVGARDLMFSSRIRRRIMGARSYEREIEKRISGEQDSPQE
jgi:hypothetical protein